MGNKPALAGLLAVIAAFALPNAGSASVTNTRITSGPTGTIFVDSATFTFTSPLHGGFECRLDPADGGDWTTCASPMTHSALADGPHTFEVRAKNGTGHPDPTPASRSFIVNTDTEPPETTITGRPSGRIATGSAVFRFESTEPGGFECRLDSSGESAWAPCASPRSYTSLGNGSHRFEVRASDEAGNTDPTPADATFAVDTAPPETAITSAPSGTIEVTSASFEFSATEASSFQCRLDSDDPAAWSACSSPRSYTTLADGPHDFEVRARDQLGNTDPTPALAAFAVDTGPPDPVAGQTLNLVAVDGNVQLQCPGEASFSRLVGFKQVPVGCLINARNGVVDLTASKGSSGELQGAHFWAGVFIASQEAGDNQKVDLKLAGRRMCERRGSAQEPAARASRSGRSGRRVWGSGKGNYSTRGSYGSATVSGTTWLVVDRCDSSTLFRVTEGALSIRDFVKGKSLTLSAGRQYIAKAPIPRLNPEALP